MQRFWFLAVMTGLLVSISACEGGIAPGQEIVLPAGDPVRGEAAFVALECTACHTVQGKDLQAADEMGPVTIKLGGNVAKAKSYSELVTSVINPSHKLARNLFNQEIEQDGESIMPIYNDVMTVTQLVDIVAFLEDNYEIIERPRYRYPVYKY